MKFDYAIGNPPYQDDKIDNSRKPPLYHLFLDSARKVSDHVELITPARFLFDAGQTPKQWNKKMLNDEHFKVLFYEPDASKIFQNTEIKGGVCVSYIDSTRTFEPIEIFTEYKELRSILAKVKAKKESKVSKIVVGAVPYKFSDELRTKYPDYVSDAGKSFDLRTNTLDKLKDMIFFEKPSESMSDPVEIFGLINKKRGFLWIDSELLVTPKNFDGYKVLLPKASGTGSFGETLASPEILKPRQGHTQSFISIGNFKNEAEAVNLEKYIRTKFFRALLEIVKKTQDMTADKFKLIPTMNFKADSDIDWSKSITEIDQQLYRKYGLSDDEITFIEEKVQAME